MEIFNGDLPRWWHKQCSSAIKQAETVIMTKLSRSHVVGVLYAHARFGNCDHYKKVSIFEIAGLLFWTSGSNLKISILKRFFVTPTIA